MAFFVQLIAYKYINFLGSLVDLIWCIAIFLFFTQTSNTNYTRFNLPYSLLASDGIPMVDFLNNLLGDVTVKRSKIFNYWIILYNDKILHSAFITIVFERFGFRGGVDF